MTPIKSEKLGHITLSKMLEVSACESRKCKLMCTNLKTLLMVRSGSFFSISLPCLRFFFPFYSFPFHANVVKPCYFDPSIGGSKLDGGQNQQIVLRFLFSFLLLSFIRGILSFSGQNYLFWPIISLSSNWVGFSRIHDLLGWFN